MQSFQALNTISTEAALELAPGPHLVNAVVEGPHSLLNWGVGVRPVRKQHVNILHTHTLEGGLRAGAGGTGVGAGMGDGCGRGDGRRREGDGGDRHRTRRCGRAHAVWCVFCHAGGRHAADERPAATELAWAYDGWGLMGTLNPAP